MPHNCWSKFDNSGHSGTGEGHQPHTCKLQQTSFFKWGASPPTRFMPLKVPTLKSIFRLKFNKTLVGINHKPRRLLRSIFFWRNEVCLIKFSLKWRSKYFIWKLRCSANFWHLDQCLGLSMPETNTESKNGLNFQANTKTSKTSKDLWSSFFISYILSRPQRKFDKISILETDL